MRDNTIRCDHCGDDLTTTTNCVDYRLRLSVERIPSAGGVVTLMNIAPPMDDDKDFCGFACLRQWLENN